MTQEKQSIIAEHELPHSPAKVWRAITEPQLVSTWLMQNDLEATVGHRFTFQARPMPGWDGVVHCEVLDAVPEKLLRYSWKGGKDELDGYGSRLDTIVTFTLTATASGGTLLRLEHSGFAPKNAFAFDMMSKGWTGMVSERISATIEKNL